MKNSECIRSKTERSEKIEEVETSHGPANIIMFSSNFSVKSGISAGEKFAFRTFFAGRAMLKKQRERNDVNWLKMNYN